MTSPILSSFILGPCVFPFLVVGLRFVGISMRFRSPSILSSIICLVPLPVYSIPVLFPASFCFCPVSISLVATCCSPSSFWTERSASTPLIFWNSRLFSASFRIFPGWMSLLWMLEVRCQNGGICCPLMLLCQRKLNRDFIELGSESMFYKESGGQFCKQWAGGRFLGVAAKSISSVLIWPVFCRFDIDCSTFWEPRQLNTLKDYMATFGPGDFYSYMIRQDCYALVEHIFGEHSIDRFNYV